MKKREYDMKLVLGQEVSESKIFLLNSDIPCRECVLLFKHKTIGIHEFASRDYFEALVLLRLFLEELGVSLLCNGARVDLYPSGMSRDMAKGIKAAVLAEHGKRPQTFNIFEYQPGIQLATVAEQKAFYQSWLRKRGIQ